MRPAAYPIIATLLATPAVAQDRPLTADVTEVYRVGGVNAEEWAFFGPALQPGFDGAGNLVVLDAFNKRVVVIGPDGRLVRVVGREGEGPGEFQQVQVRHREIRADPLGDRLIAQGVEGVLVEMANLMYRLRGDPEEDPQGVDDRALETLDFTGDVIVARPILQGWRAPRPPPLLSATQLEDWPKVVASLQDRYFEPGLHWDVLPDGTIAYSDSSAYDIKLAGPDGALIDVLTRPLSPEAVSERMQRATIAFHIQRLEARLARGPSSAGPLPPGDPEESRQRIRDRAFFHEVPVVRGIGASWDGGLWIHRRGEVPWEDEGPIDVFSADRDYLGTLPSGEPAMPIAFGPDGLVVHLERDELDVPTLVVSRVVVGGA